MKGYSDELPEMVRRRLVSCGDVGVAWMNGLDRLVSDLAEQWELTLGRILTGGTAAFVAEAITADGTSAVLKLKIPGEDPTRSELRMLLAARGRGYPLVLKHDETKDALLLERLGAQLAELELPVRAQLEIICSTLEEAWISGASAGGFQTGAEKATALAGGITQMWRELGQPCSERLITRALEFTARRRQAFVPESSVLAHGDVHPWNTLLVPGTGAERFKFVDPDGLFIERAYDLGILMREWEEDVLAGDILTNGRARCLHLSRITGIEPDAIWQWGLIERTSTGLLLKKLGVEKQARQYLEIAEAWAMGDSP